MSETKKEITKEEIYQEFRKDVLLKIEQRLDDSTTEKDLKKRKLSAKGKRHFVIPYFDEAGLDTWDKIFEENKLIAQKKSNLPVSLRNAIVTFVLFIEAEYYSENGLSGNN